MNRLKESPKCRISLQIGQSRAIQSPGHPIKVTYIEMKQKNERKIQKKPSRSRYMTVLMRVYGYLCLNFVPKKSPVCKKRKTQQQKTYFFVGFVLVDFSTFQILRKNWKIEGAKKNYTENLKEKIINLIFFRSFIFKRLEHLWNICFVISSFEGLLNFLSNKKEKKNFFAEKVTFFDVCFRIEIFFLFHSWLFNELLLHFLCI